ncbi:MAG: Cell wall assembly regulator [Caeruleum heppii]|nr:MAG: Cell wall assembly regulator [Caeruleum heppii]
MLSNDRHASHDSPYRTGQHMPLSTSRHGALSSIATPGVSQADLESPYLNEGANSRSTATLPNGYPGSPTTQQPPSSPYSPGMRSSSANLRKSSSHEAANPFDSVTPGEIQLQNFQEGLPPPPPVSHAWKRIDRWAEENYEELFDQLADGASSNDLNELEHMLDCSLPMEVRESLQVHDGQERGGRPTGIIFGCMLLDCEEIVQEWQQWRKVNDDFLNEQSQRQQSQSPFRPFAGGSSSAPPTQQSPNPLWRQDLQSRQDSQPPNAIQKVYAHPGWIPLARDWGGNNLAVDLAPGPMGKWGQVIIFGRDYDCKCVVARSWSAFLATVADDLGGEKVYVDEETQELKLREFKTTTVEPGYLDILRWRMDQKYGRKGPKRRSGMHPNGGHPNQHHSNGNGHAGPASPYGSPTFPDPERGRSTSRSAGPAGPSPLARVTEENNNMAPLVDGASSDGRHGSTSTEGSGKLVEAPTPTANGNPIKTGLDGMMDPSVDPERKGRGGMKADHTKVEGLGVKGIEHDGHVDGDGDLGAGMLGKGMGKGEDADDEEVGMKAVEF